MDEAWERAVEAALEGQAESSSSPRTLTLDGVVKCLHGRLPPPSFLEKFHDLEHLSIANIGVSSLEKFPRLRNLQRLILSDNRIAGGLEYLVEAGLDSLRDLDLSNNRIQFLEDLAPLARLRLVSLDLYECPVTRTKDYRSKVFGLIRSLKYLDKMDADENERPESDDDEEEDEEDEEDEIDGEDPGSGEIDGEDRTGKAVNCSGGDEAVDEDEESDADEEETETGKVRRLENGSSSHHSNGFRVEAINEEEDEEDEDDEYEDDDLGEGEEIDEEDDDDDDGDDDVEEDVVEVHDVVDSDEDGVEEEDDEDEIDEDVEVAVAVPRAEGEIDGHEQGEEDDENGEIGEADEEKGVDEDRDSEEDEEEEDLDGEFLVQPIPRERGRESEIDAACNEEDEDEVDDAEEYRLSNGGISKPSSSQPPTKRKRDEDGDEGLRSSKNH